MLQPSSDAAGAAYRRKVLTKLLMFVVLAVVIWLQPKIQAWLEGRNAAGSKNADAVAKHDTDPSDTFQPSGDHSRVVIKDIDEPVVAEVDRSDPVPAQESLSDKTQISQPRTETASPGVSVSEQTGTQSKTDRSKTANKNKGSDLVRMDRDPAGKQRPSGRDPAANTKTPDTPTTPSDGAEAETEPVLGQLREIRNKVFESTAGLRYAPGSQDNHRLDHVMQHAKDDTTKPIHGVFEGNRDQILAVIDEAYQKAKKGGRDVRSEEQNDRLVYTVNLGRKIGYMGGSGGERAGNPDCRYLRIVLEDGNVVISAYPTKSF
ncbi:MAG: hypothetical protein H7Z17_06790 [Fuerstia sp.]|nr:hypothetical protein [Fuerstiella sp.]